MESEIKTKLKKAAQIFKKFAEVECKQVSKLYFQLAHQISEEEDLLHLSLHRKARQPIPNLLLGAVHYLLLKNPKEELAQFYPSITKHESREIPIQIFKEICARRKQEIIKILQKRIVQTNAINRTAYLMPIASSLFKKDKKLTIVDIGTSSGLSLNFDQYQYVYKANLQFGDAPVKIKSNILEGQLPKFDQIKQVNRKIGIDQNPLNLNHFDDATWLKALIWPDQLHRFERMEKAIELAQSSKLELIKANTIEGFRKAIAPISQEEDLLIYHTHVLYQFTSEERTQFRAFIDELARERDLHYLAVEGYSVFDRSDYNNMGVVIELNQYLNGIKSTKILGLTDGHANWIKWKA